MGAFKNLLIAREEDLIAQNMMLDNKCRDLMDKLARAEDVIRQLTGIAERISTASKELTETATSK